MVASKSCLVAPIRMAIAAIWTPGLAAGDGLASRAAVADAPSHGIRLVLQITVDGLRADLGAVHDIEFS